MDKTNVLMVCFCIASLGTILVESQMYPSSRITATQIAKPKQFPYQVSVQNVTSKSITHICGGTIINKNQVLTSAQCVHDPVSKKQLSPGKLQIFAGDIKLPPKLRQNFTVSKIIVHEKYNVTPLENNIAIIQINGQFPMTPYIKSIDIIKNSTFTKPGSSCVVSGWGKTRDSDTSMSSDLKYANVTIRNHGNCKKNYLNNKINIADTMICANGNGYPSPDICQGDFGGPLVCNGTLTGVASFGYKCGLDSTYPGVYTNVYNYTKWISSKKTSAGSTIFFQKLTIIPVMILVINYSI